VNLHSQSESRTSAGIANALLIGIWVEPKLLAEIEYRAKSAEGKVRHPFFKGLREDM
jgi:ATP-dependent DNA ligase